MFGHFLNERVGLGSCEAEERDGVNPVVESRNRGDSFAGEELLDFSEVVFGTGANGCCCHFLEFSKVTT